VLPPDSQRENGCYFRSGHFNLAKWGVPAPYVKSGADSRDHPPGWIEARERGYVAHCDHKAGDADDPSWDLAGSLEDPALLCAVGRRASDATRWPAGYRSSEFRAAREASRPPPSR
jgi:hypothetical protein